MKAKQRTLVILLVLVLVLGGALFWLNRSNTQAEQAASAAAEGSITLSSFAAGDVIPEAGHWRMTRITIWTNPPAAPWSQHWHL